MYTGHSLVSSLSGSYSKSHPSTNTGVFGVSTPVLNAKNLLETGVGEEVRPVHLQSEARQQVPGGGACHLRQQWGRPHYTLS